MQETVGKLILIRHGKAEPREGSVNDAQRKLTEKGRKDLEKILPELTARLEPGREFRLISSPLPRATQTAEIIGNHLGIEEIEQLDWMGSGDYEGLQEKLKGLDFPFSVGIVGHEPYLSAWSRQFTGFTIPFGKGSAVGFRVISQEPLCAEPEWILSPETVNPPELNIKHRLPALPEFKKILRSQIHEIFNALQKFLDAPDKAETTHQFRVKIRAFRSVLSFIKPLLEPEQYKKAQEGMKKLSQRMGRLREIDVLKSEWTKLLKAHPQLIERQSILAAVLSSERQKEQAEICGDASGMMPVIFDLWNWIESAFVLEAIDREPTEDAIKSQEISFAAFCHKRIRNRVKKARAGFQTIDCSDFRSIHALRVQFKKLRYALSVLDPLLDLNRTETIALLKTLQDIFGDYCDTQRNLSILKELSAHCGDPELCFEIGALSGYQTRLAEETLRKINRADSIEEWPAANIKHRL